jgi:hypothetical protein
MTATAIAATGAAHRDLPVITDCKVQAQMYSRSAVVRLPKGLVAQDLHDWSGKIWGTQKTNNALRKFDTVTIIAHDESWMIPDAVVTSIDQGVKLDFKRIVQL